MMKDAEANKEADQKRKEEAEVKNETEQMIFTAEKAIKDLDGKVTEDEKKDINALIEDAKKAMEGNDIEAIKNAKDKLAEKAMALSSRVYEEAAKEAQAKEQSSNENADNSSNDGNVKEANFEEK